jgi:hypothetical protein
VKILGLPEFLDWYDEGVLEQVTVHHPVAHRDVIVIAARGKQRIPLVIS